MNTQDQQLDEIITLAEQGTRRLNKFFYVGMVCGLILGPLTIWATYNQTALDFLDLNTERDTQMARIFGIVMSGLFLLAIGEQWIKVRKDRKLIKALRHHPEKLAWVYKEISTGEVRKQSSGARHKVATFYHAYFHLVDGSRTLVWLNEAGIDRLIALVVANFANVTVGYNEKLLQEYQNTPASLRKNPRRVDGVKRVTSGAAIRH